MTNDKVNDVNALHNMIFITQLATNKRYSEKAHRAGQLPTAIWHGALANDPVEFGPEGQSWKVSEGHFLTDVITQQPAPVSILMLSSCQCKATCHTPVCSCEMNGWHVATD